MKEKEQMKQQTAVDYLLNYCERENWSIPVAVKRHAREMEKEQIMSAYNNCELCDPEQYYNETYGGNK